MNTGKNIVIFSVDRFEVPFGVLDAARKDAMETLDNVKAIYRVVDGAYKHVQEKTFIVTLPTPYVSAHTYDVMGAILSLIQRHDQESYLYIDVNGYTTLEKVYSKESVPLSPLKEVSKEYALSIGNYTIIDDKYYSAN